jgi:hypothetical protein
MLHPNTERLAEYWRDQAGPTGLPERTAINPADFARLLPQVFMLGRTEGGVLPFRLVGGFVADLHARDLRGINVLTLWSPRDQLQLRSVLDQTRRRPQPVVVTAEARTAQGESLAMEVLFAPLSSRHGTADRFIGLYQPLGLVQKLDGEPVQQMVIQAIEGAEAETPALRLAALDGRVVA